jgi:hypothetical protein
LRSQLFLTLSFLVARSFKLTVFFLAERYFFWAVVPVVKSNACSNQQNYKEPTDRLSWISWSRSI